MAHFLLLFVLDIRALEQRFTSERLNTVHHFPE